MSSWAERTWQGDWKARILERLAKEGYGSVGDYLARYPGIPHLDLAQRLGFDVAASQLIYLQIGEALEKGTIRHAAMDMLLRSLRRHLPKGWLLERGHEVDFKTASALGDWISEFRLDDRVIRYYPRARAVAESLIALGPPVGWNPLDIDDSYLRQAFTMAWPPSDTPQ
jgi:hypothetical protein